MLFSISADGAHALSRLQQTVKPGTCAGWGMQAMIRSVRDFFTNRNGPSVQRPDGFKSIQIRDVITQVDRQTTGIRRLLHEPVHGVGLGAVVGPYFNHGLAFHAVVSRPQALMPGHPVAYLWLCLWTLAPVNCQAMGLGFHQDTGPAGKQMLATLPGPLRPLGGGLCGL